jgi:hypothetical protein
LDIRFQKPQLPNNLQITTDGILTCKPLEPDKTWNIPVWVEDYMGIRAYRELSLSTGPLGTHGTGITEASIRIYPNPVTDRAFVEIESMVAGNIDLNIFDLTGKILLTRNYAVKAGKSLFTINLNSDIAPGIYIVRVTGITNYQSKIYLSIPEG